MGVLMPRTSSDIGGMRGLLRAQRRQTDEILGETIKAHAEEAGTYAWPLRTRLIEFSSEGERGPPR